MNSTIFEFMNFVHPNILWFLGLLVIPIIIHFFHFRKYKKVAFSDISMLQMIQEQKRSRRNVKHWIILLLRLLAISCVVFSFAQPYIPLGNNEDKITQSVHAFYIDNSFSMNAEGEKGMLLEAAKKDIFDITSSLSPTDEVFLITNDMIPEQMKTQDITSFQNQLSSVQSSSVHTPFSQIVTATKDIILQRDHKENVNLYVVSDVQKSQFDFGNILPSEQMQYTFIKNVAVQESNVYIDSIWIDNPVIKMGLPVTISFSVINDGETSLQDVPVYLDVDDNPKGVSNVTIDANSKTEGQISFIPKKVGDLALKVSLEDKSITFDDQFYGVLSVKEKVKIAIINDEESTKALKKLYQLDAYYEVEEVNLGQLNVDVFSFDLVIFNDIKNFPTGLVPTLKEYVEQGGSVVLSPSIGANISSFQGMINAVNGPALGSWKVSTLPLQQIDYSNLFFDRIFEKEENISMPNFKEYIEVNRQSKGFLEPLLSFKNNAPFISLIKHKKGQFYIQAAPFNTVSNSWTQHALFTAVYLRIAERSKEKLPLYYTIAKDYKIVLNSSINYDQNALISLQENGEEIVKTNVQKNNGTSSISIGNDNFTSLQKDGIYDLKINEKKIQRIAFNYDRKESKMLFNTIEDITAEMQTNNLILNKAIEAKNENVSTINTKSEKEYWRILLILSIVFLTIETVINRFWKTA